MGIEPKTPAIPVQDCPYQRKPSVEGQFKQFNSSYLYDICQFSLLYILLILKSEKI